MGDPALFVDVEQEKNSAVTAVGSCSWSAVDSANTEHDDAAVGASLGGFQGISTALVVDSVIN